MDEIKKLIDDYLSHCKYEKNLSPLSLKAYLIDLKQFQQYISRTPSIKTIAELDKHLIRDYLKEIFPQNKPKTVKRKLATVKAFMNHLEYEDILLVNPFRKIKINIKEGKQLPKIIELDKIQKLFAYLYQRKEFLSKKKNSLYENTVRDIAVLELLFATGVRVSELSNLKTNNLNLSKGLVLIKGKGNRERVIPIVHREILNALKSYYKLFKVEIFKGDFFFVNRLNSRLSDQSIRLMIRNHTKSINLQQRITPHMFRHSVATYLLENGADIRYIQNILGHSSINTTQIYTQVNEGPKRKVIRLKHPRGRFNLK
jgi:integrase/recombinase XerD